MFPLLPLFTMVAGLLSSPDQPAMSVRIRPEKSEYLLGEPTRLTVVVHNLSPSILIVSRQGHYSIAADSRIELREDRMLSDRSIDLAPNDSTLFFLYPDYTIRSRDANGDWPWCRDYRTFGRPGEFVVRVSAHASIKEWTNPYSPSGGVSVSAWSNEVRLRFREPRPREAKILDAIWDVNYTPSWDSEDEAKKLARLRTAALRWSTSPMTSHIRYATLRMLAKPPIEYPDEAALREAEILAEAVASGDPNFRPDEVAYYQALIDFRQYQAGFDSFGLRRARETMRGLMAAHPELHAHPEISFLADRVQETGEEIEVRLGMDKSEFVLGEPTLLRISMVNRSTRTVRGPGPMQLIPNGDRYACFIEIERPDGVRELRTTNRPIVCYIGGSPSEAGVPLAPGDSVVSQLRYNIAQVFSEAFGYRRSEAQWEPFSQPGRYRVRAGYGLSERAWRLTGAGRLALSKSVDILVRAPDESEAKLLNALRESTEKGVNHAFINDSAGLAVLQNALADNPEHPLAFYLKRIVAQTYRVGTRGMDEDLSKALRMYEALLSGASGLRRQELEMQVLETYVDMNRHGDLVHDLRDDAERLVLDMAAKDPSLGTNQRFQYLSCAILLAEFGDQGAGRANYWWLQFVADKGPHAPSWDDLETVAASAPARPEPVGPFEPRPKPRRHHIVR